MPNLNGTNGDDNIEVNSDTGTVNGGPGVTPVDNINARRGDDTISVDDSTVGGNMNAAAGNDSVTVSNNSTIEGNIQGGAGNDTISVDDSTVDGNITTSRGNDVITVSNNSNVAGNIESGANNDSIVVDGSTVDGNIAAGGGSDTIGVVDATIDGNVEGGGGNDTFLFPVGTVVDDDNEGSFVITPGFSGTLSSGTATLPSGQEIEYDGFEQVGVICFAGGTLIKTMDGETAVEDLMVGDRVLTMDSGYLPISWIGHRRYSKSELILNSNLCPIRIRAGALGAGIPNNDLVVSPQHRIMVNSKIAARMFGQSEVLVAAKNLLAIDGIETLDPREVTYFHFLFENHEIVFANGAPAESLFTGPEALKTLSAEAKREIFTIFPELKQHTGRTLSRQCPSGRRGRRLAERANRNGRALCELTTTLHWQRRLHSLP